MQQSPCTGPACSRCPGRTTSPDGGSVPACGNASRTIADVPRAHVDGTTINTVWGGHSARDDDGSWHFFGSAIMDGGSLSRWTDDSCAIHGVGNSSTRFSLSNIALRPGGGDAWDGGSIHGVYLTKNPKPWPNKTDTWLLFYTGYPKRNPLGNRRIGVAYSKALHGPWTRWGPVLSANTNSSAVDSSSVSNAAPAFARDGSGRILLAYKGLGKVQPSKPPCTDGSGKACISVASAPHWTGPYEHVTANEGLIILGEDPTLWHGPRGWHMVYEHYTADKRFSGTHAWSVTGLTNWTTNYQASAEEECPMVPVATGLNGTAAALTKRERYQVTLDADGHPALLFNGACSGDSCFNIVQAFAKTDDGGSRLSAKSDDERSQGQTFFVDPDGDDSAAGTSAAEAWRTVARVNQQQLKPGESVLFKRGGGASLPLSAVSALSHHNIAVSAAQCGAARRCMARGALPKAGLSPLAHTELPPSRSPLCSAQSRPATRGFGRRLRMRRKALGPRTSPRCWRPRRTTAAAACTARSRTTTRSRT